MSGKVCGAADLLEPSRELISLRHDPREALLGAVHVRGYAARRRVRLPALLPRGAAAFREKYRELGHRGLFFSLGRLRRVRCGVSGIASGCCSDGLRACQEKGGQAPAPECSAR